LKINNLVAFSAVFWLAAGAALAKPMPEPPPSGIVVHLFGPDSITSNILPQAAAPAPAAQAANAPVANGPTATAPAAAPAGTTQPVTSTASVPPPGPGGTVQPAAAPAATAYQGPSLHDILHQMFVTGDPNITPQEKLAPGRTKDHPQ
jgi:hypothetical protein